MIKRVALLLTLVLEFSTFSSSRVLAQGGSNYSALGIGDMRPTVGGMYDAMAGTGIAIPTGYGINIINPALIGMAVTTRLQAGYRFNQHVITSGDASSAQNNGELDGLIAMFSIDTSRGFGMSIGILPYSSLNYSTARSLTADMGGQTISGKSYQTGTGGASQLQIQSSVRLFSDLRIGLSFAGLFGILEYKDQVKLDGNFFDVTSTQDYDIRGLLFRGGIVWEPKPWLYIGGYFSTGTNASVYITRRAVGVDALGAYYDSTQIDASETQLPTTAGIGVAYLWGNNRLGADVTYGNYTGMTVNARPDAQYSTSLRASLGYTHPGEMTNLSTFFDKIGYHAGASWEKMYVTYNGNSLYEYLGAFGISFPLGGNAMVDAGVQAGFRGPQAVNNLTEIIARLTVSVSIGETWFKPFARD